MKMITKIGCFLLSLTLILGAVFIPATAAEEINQEAMKTVDLFRTLGVIPDYYDYNIDMNREMTRADFAHAAFKLVAPAEYKATQTYYYDVPETYWAYDAIGYLTEQGILHGSDEKIFEPDALIEQAAAYKIMISLLGYGEYAYYNGGYPSGYAKIANRLGICEGCSSNKYLTMSDMLILLFKSGTCGILEPNGYGTESTEYSVSETETLFSVYKNLYYQEGIVEGAAMTSISDVALAEEDDVLIDGAIYKSEPDMYSYLGEEVEILYNYNKSSEEKKIVWAYRTGMTEAVTLTVDKDASFDSGTFTLKKQEDNGKEKQYRLDKNVRVILNGGSTGKSVADVLNMPRYEVKLAGEGSAYTTALVRVPELFVVGSVSKREKLVYDQINPTRSISLDSEKYDYMSLTLQGKAAIEFADIAIGNVLSIFASEDGTRMEVHVANTTVSGSISTIKVRDSGTIYTVLGVEYYEPSENKHSEFSVGDSVILYLDVRGEVAYIRAGEGNGFAAFLIKAALTNEGFNESLKLHLIGQDGIIADRECADKIVIDGISYKDAGEAYNALCEGDGAFKPQLSMITYNSNEEISSIDTPTKKPDESDYTLTVNVPYMAGQYYKWFSQIGPMSPVNDSTVFFSVPDDADMAKAEDDDFEVLNRSDFVNDSSHSLETYKTVPKSEIEQYVVLRGSSSKELRYSDNPLVATGIGEALDKDGMQVECLEAYEGTELVSIPAEYGLSLKELGIEEGDIVRIRKNGNGEIVNASLVIDKDEIDTALTTTSSFNSAYRLVVGHVHDVVGSVIKIGESDPATPTHITYGTGIPVIVYDASEREPVRVGEMNDADTWYTAGAGCSRVVLLTKTASPQMMIIYKK